jgi:hypothetical protein
MSRLAERVHGGVNLLMGMGLWGTHYIGNTIIRYGFFQNGVTEHASNFFITLGGLGIERYAALEFGLERRFPRLTRALMYGSAAGFNVLAEGGFLGKPFDPGDLATGLAGAALYPVVDWGLHKLTTSRRTGGR